MTRVLVRQARRSDVSIFLIFEGEKIMNIRLLSKSCTFAVALAMVVMFAAPVLAGGLTATQSGNEVTITYDANVTALAFKASVAADDVTVEGDVPAMKKVQNGAVELVWIDIPANHMTFTLSAPVSDAQVVYRAEAGEIVVPVK